MTLASLLALFVSGRLGMRTRLTTQAERSGGAGDVRRPVLGVASTTLAIELVTAVLIAVRFHLGHGLAAWNAVCHGIFYGISAFDNAGFGLRNDNLVGYANDPWIVLPIAVASVLVALGFPVLLELLRNRGGTRRRRSLHTRLTLFTSAVLLAVGIPRVVVGIGTDLEASILTTSNLVDADVAGIWAPGQAPGSTVGSWNVSVPTTSSCPNTTRASAWPTWSPAGCWTSSPSTATTP